MNKRNQTFQELFKPLMAKLNPLLNKAQRLDPFRWKGIYLLLAYLIPCIGMLTIMFIGKYEPFGDGRSMLYSDMYHQYYPFFVAFRDNLLSGNGLMISWDVGMGLDYLGLISYYLGSPLNLLCLLVPESMTLELFSLLMPLKLGFAGLFFAFFLKSIFKKNDFSICVFGGLYATCAFAMAYQWNVMWLDSFALLPLVVTGMVNLLRERKFILYTVALFFCFISNYYIGYIVCLFIFLAFFCYEICRFPGVKRFLQDFARIAVFSMIAIGMTLSLTLPGISALMQTQSSEDLLLPSTATENGIIAELETTKPKTGLSAVLETFCVNIVGPYEYDFYERYYDDYSKAEAAWNALKAAKAQNDPTFKLSIDYFFACLPLLKTGMARIAGNLGGGQELGFMEGLPNVYCGIGTVLLALLFLTAKEVKLRDKLCTLGLIIFLMLSCIIRPLDYMWHGFHFTNMIPYRFSFLISFVLLYMGYKGFTLRHTFKLWQLTIAGVLCMFILGLSDNREDMTFIAYNLAFLLMTLGFLLFTCIESTLPTAAERNAIPKTLQLRHSNMVAGALACVLFLELVMNMVNFGTRFPFTDITDYPSGNTDSAAVIEYMKDREGDDGFYRTEVTHSQTLNDGALNRYNGISTFSSSANSRVTKFMQNLGQAALPEWNRYCYEDSSPVANLFLNLKYMIERDNPVFENDHWNPVFSKGDVTLLENKSYLPLGFLAETTLAQSNMSSISGAFEKQNALFSAATGLSGNVWNSLPEECLNITTSGATITSQTPNGYVTYTATSQHGTIHFNYTPDREGLLCFNVDFDPDCSYAIFVNRSLLCSDSENLPQMVAACNVKPGDLVEFNVYYGDHSSGTITVNNAILDAELFQQGYDILNASTLNLTKFSDTRIEGTINCDRDGLLYTSIPDNGYWSVLVDGKKASVTLVENAMVGVLLTEGTHTVTFVYTNTAFIVGLICSILCLACFVLLILMQRRYWSKSGGAAEENPMPALETVDADNSGNPPPLPTGVNQKRKNRKR